MSYTDYSNYYESDCNQVQNLTNSKTKCQTFGYFYCDENYENNINIESCTNLFKPIDCIDIKGREYYENYYDQFSIPYINYQDPSCSQNFIIEILVSNYQIPNMTQSNISPNNNSIIRSINNSIIESPKTYVSEPYDNSIIRTTSSNSTTRTNNNNTIIETINNSTTKTTIKTNNNPIVTQSDPIIGTINNSTIDTISNPYIESTINLIKLPSKKIDPVLINPWGIAIINNYIWIANTGSGLITVYNTRGETMMLPIYVYGPNSIIAQPTGLSYNSNNNSFIVSSGLLSGPATIIIVTLNGTIHGYNNLVDSRNSIMVLNNFSSGAIYTGVTIVNNILYVANFGNKRIDVFDNTFKPLTKYLFIDNYLDDPIPPDFSPYNIVNIGDYLYVTYVKQNTSSKLEILGSNNGYINLFTFDGQFIKRFTSCKDLNTPWGISEAPSVFCYPPGTILVGNFGNGKINAYTNNGFFLGRVLDGNYNEIYIDALHGLLLNINNNFQIYFTSSSYNLQNGKFGYIRPGNLNI